MRPKLKLGDSILVKKNKNNVAHWGIYLRYTDNRIEYRPAQQLNIDTCSFKEIIEARDAVSMKNLK